MAGISGTAVAVTTAGFILLYSAVKDATISATLRSFIAGEGLPTKTTVFPGGVGGGSGGVAGPPSGGTANDSNAGIFRDYCLHTLGFTKAGTAGAMGNVERESGFDATNNSGDQGTSGGICQWHLGRLDALKTFARVRGMDWRDIHAQLGYMQLELTTGYADVRLAMMGATSPEEAAYYWGRRFEGCSECGSKNTGEMQARMAAARRYYTGM